jgi:hypothetical protein
VSPRPISHACVLHLPTGCVSAAAACVQPLPAATTASQLATSTYRGDRLLPSRSYSSQTQHWLRQFGMDGGRVTPMLVAVNAGAFAMQCVSPTFTNMCVRVSRGFVGLCAARGEYYT